MNILYSLRGGSQTSIFNDDPSEILSRQMLWFVNWINLAQFIRIFRQNLKKKNWKK